MTDRPLPVADDASAPFWAAAAQHRLTVARCARCASASMPPDLVCPHCGSTDPAWSFVPVSGRATVRSWTVVRQPFLPGFEADVPFVLVDAELADAPGVRLIGRLLDADPRELRLDDVVDAAFEDLAPGVAVPAFRRAR